MALRGYIINRISILRCGSDPAINFNGHSHANPSRPITRLRIWSTGTGFTAPSRFVVMKSQRSFGQIKPSMALPTWTEKMSVSLFFFFFGCSDDGLNIQAAAVRTINRAQWFLMSLPIAINYAVLVNKSSLYKK